MTIRSSVLPLLDFEGEVSVANRDRYHPSYVQLVEALIAERKSRNVTQVEVAQRMGTMQSFVSKYERREVLMDVLDYVRYCLAIGVEPVEIIAKFRWDLTNLSR
ncbi:helix-turn-helix transcriptional regulator [Azospirillum sp. Vi22]|nr:helix-turn-helix transcriptional regulator [Azospirillum baldaniorum]